VRELNFRLGELFNLNELIQLAGSRDDWKQLLPGGPFGPELEWWREGWTVIGTDEAGRGPLAGPVVAAAAAFSPGVILEGVDDSKKLSSALREKLFDQICEKALAWDVARVEHDVIDEINILQATARAMEKTVRNVSESLNVEYPGVFVDGRIPQLGLGRQVNIIKGDSISFSIGAASILAKVSRDRMMVDLDEKYPGYGFARHKGYGTRRHVEAIKELGFCPIHRRSFRIRALENETI
jgi:ribonuclease HII